MAFTILTPVDRVSTGTQYDVHAQPLQRTVQKTLIYTAGYRADTATSRTNPRGVHRGGNLDGD